MDTRTRKILKNWTRFYSQAFNILFTEGDKILDIITKNSNGKPEAISIILLMRKMIELAYGHLSLVKNNEFILIKSLNREAFETSLFLNFFQQSNTTERILSYQIHGLLERIKYHNTFDPSHQQFETYQTGLQKLNVDILSPSKKDIEELNIEIERLKAILKTPPLKEVYEKYFENTKNKKWYSIDLGRINSIKDLATHLDQEIIYLTIYRDYSEYIHGYNLVKGDIVRNSQEDGTIEFYGIPSPPTNIAHDFLFFQVMFLQSIQSSFKSLNIKSSNSWENMQSKINHHFISNDVIRGKEFIDADRIQMFPKKKNKH